MKRLDEITIADLMPDSISRDAQVSATARAIDPQLRLISEAVDRPLILASIDELSAGVLEHLAVQYDVAAWDSAWPIETKRAVLKTAIADKRKKGTRGAVERAIEAVAPIATLTEWWQDPSGEMLPHTFKIDLLQDGEAVDPETQANVIAQVDDSKPVRSHYTFTAIQKAGSGLYFAGVLRAIAYARVRSAGITIEQTEIRAGVLAALRGTNIRRLLASSHMGDMPEPVVDVALFGGDFSGNNIRMESVDGGGGLIDKFASYKALIELRGWEPGGLFIDKPRMIGICGVLTETSDSGVLVEVPKQLSVGRIEFTGSLAEGGIPESGVVEEYVPAPVEPTLYLPSGNLYEQSGVTSATNQIEKAANNETVHQLYTDPNRTIQFLPDLTKKYELGQYNNDQWEPFINEIDDMPESTVSSNSVNGYIILNSGLLWLCNNSSGDVYSQYSNGILFKEYPDEREWTTQTLYLPTGDKHYQLNSTCYTSPVPSSETYQLYTDSSRTQPFYYDLDKEYRGGYINGGSFVAYREQRVWDLTPSTTSSSSERILATILTKTGKLWFVTNSTLTVYGSDTTFVIQSTPKQYDEPTITLDLGLQNDFTGVTFSADDYWFSVLRNALDKQKAIDFGISIGSRDRIADSILDGFNLELVALCDYYENTVITDMSNFYAGTQDGALVIRSINAFSTSTNYWRVRITRKPAPVLPTVSTENDFGNYNWLDILYPPPRNIPPGISSSLPLTYLNQSVLYDQDKSYGILVWQASPGTNSGRTEFAILNHNGSIYAINVSQSSQTIYSARVAVCSSNSAEIVTVYDNQNASFNAFKYTANGTDYYYVLDNTQTDWTDDLESIGYIKSTTYTNPVTNNVYAKWRGNATSDPNYKNYFSDINGSSIGPYYSYATYMNKFYLDIPDDDYVSDTITGVTVGTRYFARASSSSTISSSTQGILILNKDSGGWYVILSFYSSDISDGNYALDGTITLLKST